MKAGLMAAVFGAALWPGLAGAADRVAAAPGLEIRTSAQFAGAVSSLSFRGREYVDTADHGRELQSAASFDGFGECFNPTEAGNAADARKPTSSSRLLSARTGPGWLETRVDMAFWLLPGTDYGKTCGTAAGVTRAVNRTVTGGYLLDKRMSARGNLLTDRVTYTVPAAHRGATFEAATLYTPAVFSRRYLVNPATGALLDATRDGEQPFPVILATADGLDAVGLWSPRLPQGGYGYGVFMFPDTSKINCVYREGAIQPGQRFTYTCVFAFGTLGEVQRTLLRLGSGR